MAMLDGHVAEMATGEGKTLAAVDRGVRTCRYADSRVHVLTVNDYLARRDATWMGPVYALLGVTVGAVGERQHATTSAPRRTHAMSPMRRSARSASTSCVIS